MFIDCVIRFLFLWTEFLVKCISLISSTVFLRICQQDHQCNQVGGIRAVLAWNETFECVSSAHYSQIFAANCISLILSTVFLLSCQLYFSYPANCISPILPTVFLLSCQPYFSYPECHWPANYWTVFLLFYQMYLSVLSVVFLWLCQPHHQCNQAGMFAWNDTRHLNAVGRQSRKK